MQAGAAIVAFAFGMSAALPGGFTLRPTDDLQTGLSGGDGQAIVPNRGGNNPGGQVGAGGDGGTQTGAGTALRNADLILCAGQVYRRRLAATPPPSSP